MADTFNPENYADTPVLPTNRAWSFDILDAIIGKAMNVEALISTSTLPWANSLTHKRIDEGLTHLVLDRIDGAQAALDALSKAIARLMPAEHAKKYDNISSIEAVLTAVERLAGQHRPAALVGVFSDFEPDEVQSVVYEVARLQSLVDAYNEAIASDIPFDKEVTSLVVAASVAAAALKSAYAAESLEQAETAFEHLVAQEADLRQHVRALSVIANRLGEPDITIDATIAVTSACELVRKAPAEVVAVLSDARPETFAVIWQAKDKAEKIARVATLLDGKFGHAWRSEPLDKVQRAAAIANTPGDLRHKGVGEYARSFGIASNYQENLTSVAKALSAINQFVHDEGLCASLPLTFDGLQTDFGKLLHAVELREKLEVILSGYPAGEKLITIFSRNSRNVIEDFFQFAALESVAMKLSGLPGDTPLRMVRSSHEDRKTWLRAQIDSVLTLPVTGEKTAARAIELSAMLGDIQRSAAGIEVTPLYITTGATHPSELKLAADWHSELEAILPAPHTPKTDEQLADLLVASREGVRAVHEWADKARSIISTLGPDSVPNDTEDLTTVYIKLDELRAVEPILHALSQLSEKRDAAVAGGLQGFMSRMTNTGLPTSDWPKYLAEDYAIVDQAAAEDAFSMELKAAAQAAADICAITAMTVPLLGSDEPLVVDDTPGSDTWIEQQISFLIADQRPKVISAE